MESTVRLDGLYPEWDEFLLSVCDICGIIIIPQALEKHYKTKHHIVVQTTNITPAATAVAVVTTPTTASTTTIPTIPTTTTNNHQPPQVQSPQSTSSSASSTASSSSLSSSAASSASNASSNSYSTSANLSHLIMLPTSKSSTNILPPSAFSSRYQDRKWRNTYNVLKDAFL